VTTSDSRRIVLAFGIGCVDVIEMTKQVLKEVVTAHPLVLSDPASAVRLNNSSVTEEPQPLPAVSGPSSEDGESPVWVKRSSRQSAKIPLWIPTGTSSSGQFLSP